MNRIRATGGSTWWFVAIGATVFALSWLLNATTPLLADDYSLAFRFGTAERIRDLSGVISSVGSLYLTWQGRLVGAFFAQTAVLVGKPVFNVANSLVFLALVVLIYFNANGRRPHRTSVFLAAPLLLWFALPSFGQSVLWLTGSAYYVWPMVLVLAALLPFRLNAENPDAVPDNAASVVGFAVLGLAAGCTNEHTAPAMLALMALWAVLWKRSRGRVPAWAIAELLGAAIGVALLLLAPGNSVRAAAAGAPQASLGVLAERIASITHAVFLDNLFALLLLFAICSLLLRRFPADKSQGMLPIGTGYMAAAFLATYAMVLSPQFPPRAWTGIVVFAVTAVLALVAGFDYEESFIRALVALTLAGAVVLFAVGFAYSYATDLRATNRAWTQRVALFDAARASGRVDVSVTPIVGLTPINPAFDVSDLSSEPGDWPNPDVARYFGLDSVALSAPGK